MYVVTLTVQFIIVELRSMEVEETVIEYIESFQSLNNNICTFLSPELLEVVRDAEVKGLCHIIYNMRKN